MSNGRSYCSSNPRVQWIPNYRHTYLRLRSVITPYLPPQNRPTLQQTLPEEWKLTTSQATSALSHASQQVLKLTRGFVRNMRKERRELLLLHVFAVNHAKAVLELVDRSKEVIVGRETLRVGHVIVAGV